MQKTVGEGEDISRSPWSSCPEVNGARGTAAHWERERKRKRKLAAKEDTATEDLSFTWSLHPSGRLNRISMLSCFVGISRGTLKKLKNYSFILLQKSSGIHSTRYPHTFKEP